jgi:hypothetical protein
VRRKNSKNCFCLCLNTSLCPVSSNPRRLSPQLASSIPKHRCLRVINSSYYTNTSSHPQLLLADFYPSLPPLLADIQSYQCYHHTPCLKPFKPQFLLRKFGRSRVHDDDDFSTNTLRRKIPPPRLLLTYTLHLDHVICSIWNFVGFI